MNFSPRLAWFSLAFLLAAVLPLSAQTPEKDATAAMETWLQGIDGGGYAPSWKESSALFQKAVTAEQWTAALEAARKPAGKCLERKLASALHQTSIPEPNGNLLKGDFVIAQFDSSFENLKYAIETVTFEKEADGTWRASGYFIKPKL